ncbi:tRNA (adenosine(37)-N6)-threonylcarbamoyltransferase complex transferase subunit TsaD [Candidatus Peregrinibacteria bacterium HGW-Peregrinibacteria-1]|jgi:N6-L-threonylcarbamoyladenine synthase|nr:MAG: tRNA (adenosine(37)-N6)-threonylcarbamoyltransferase complex transferase subunit TsaD [Candidatus Peregrinibacteria bacterium HGW-Peregrinibacteria-1]
MKILGIETSCDETAVAVVEDGKRVLCNVIASQIDIHALTGGVVPEVAAREHVMNIIPALQEALSGAGVAWNDIDALAVTQGPGLISSLVVGTVTASTISHVLNKPLIPVQHIVGHIYANWLETDTEIQFPVLILTVSGGHNELILMKGHDDFEVIGETLDDAAGEAFDKVARLLRLGYPGGPVISKLAMDGDSERFQLPNMYLSDGSLDFSFSGLKSAVLREVQAFGEIDESSGEWQKFQKDMAASFQRVVVEVLSEKLMWALERHSDVKEIHLAGGVSANLALREAILAKKPEAVVFRYPKSLEFCTDNAAMIAGAAFFVKSNLEVQNVVADSSMEL